MDIKKTIPFDVIPKTFIVPNPKSPIIHIVTPEESGYNHLQVFTQNTFCQNITSQFIGLSKTDDGNAHPTYASEVTTQDLFLGGKKGYYNGPDILNKICKETFSQTGFLSARSINESDLQFFNYKNEKLDYWVATPVKENHFFYMYAISNGEDRAYFLSNSIGNEKVHHCPIRAVFTLDCIVTDIGDYNNWIEL